MNGMKMTNRYFLEVHTKVCAGGHYSGTGEKRAPMPVQVDYRFCSQFPKGLGREQF